VDYLVQRRLMAWVGGRVTLCVIGQNGVEAVDLGFFLGRRALMKILDDGWQRAVIGLGIPGQSFTVRLCAGLRQPATAALARDHDRPETNRTVSDNFREIAAPDWRRFRFLEDIDLGSAELGALNLDAFAQF
jgi:hypothetical protein